MEKRVISTEYVVYNKCYPPHYDLLCQSALRAREKSYSPYSHFRVGAAVLLDNGVIVEGANQENGAYPLGSCAERVVLNLAAVTYPNAVIKAIAICGGTKTLSSEPVSPCGGCRQLFIEQIRRQGCDFEVIIFGKDESRVMKATVLLPFSFTL